MILLLLTPGCFFEAHGGLLDSASDTAQAEDSEISEEDTEVEDTGEAPDPLDVDNDGDGLSEREGDCDDGDDSIFPGAWDGCDGIDQDCDDEVDEGAVDDDDYEPNDDAPWWLGNLDDALSFSVTAHLHNDNDTDRFTFEVSDNWFGDPFPVNISLSNIPDDANYRLQVNLVESHGDAEPGQMDVQFGNGSLVIILEDETGPENGGIYEVVVDAIANADCGLPYQLNIQGE